MVATALKGQAADAEYQSLRLAAAAAASAKAFWSVGRWARQGVIIKWAVNVPQESETARPDGIIRGLPSRRESHAPNPGKFVSHGGEFRSQGEVEES